MRSSATTVLVSALVTACTCAGSEARDSGIDTGNDAGVDGGHDAGADAHDSGVDAWLADGGWIPVPGAPVGCLEMASPELVAATTWPIEPCPDRAGCRRIASPGGPVGSNPFRVEAGHGTYDGTRGLFAVFHDVGISHTDEWIVDDQGHGVAGFRGPQVRPEGEPCFKGFFDVSASHLAFALAGQVATTLYNDLMRGPIGVAPALATDLSAGRHAAGFVQEIRIDTGRVAAWMSSQVIQAVEVDGTLSTIADIGAGCHILDVQGDAIFLQCVPSSTAVVYAQLPGGPLEVLLDQTLSNDALDTDGTTMAWLRYRPVDGGRATEVWTSPHAVHAVDVHERQVANLPPNPAVYANGLRIGFGYAVVAEQSDVLGVYRLADGARAIIHAPPGEDWSGFVQYVGPVEIAATSGPVPSTVPLSDSALMFIRIDSLTFVPP